MPLQNDKASEECVVITTPEGFRPMSNKAMTAQDDRYFTLITCRIDPEADPSMISRRRKQLRRP